MVAPAGAGEVQFNVATASGPAAQLHDGIAKIGPGFAVPKAGMEDAYGLPIKRAESITVQPLVLPDGLKQPLGRNPGPGGTLAEG
jgi:hypothetical protein